MKHTDALDVLQDIYGYDSFRSDQADIIDTLIDGNDALVLMPTGGGKSLCYQIPALVRNGTGVVISPLIALMQDQVDALCALNLNAVFINSSLSAAQIRITEEALLKGEVDLLYVAPERLLMPAMLNLLDQIDIALFAIDEAHCVSQWGHDFRREYLALDVLHERFPDTPRVALTATADQRTRGEIIENLALNNAARFISSFDRPNIRYAIHEANNARDAMLRFINDQHANDAGIVYCLSRRKVEDTAKWLSENGKLALPYHAGLDADTRSRHQSRFLREEGVIIVATIAFGMGIDKPDVRFVAHLNLPKSVEAYYQETGRAGRDGLDASAWMSYGLQDVINLRAMMQGSEADEQHKRVEHQKLDAMLGLAETGTCRRHAILSYFDEAASTSCGNCDNCLTPPETWDATEAAQKALSCVYRTGQRFGVNYLIDVLTGKDVERIRRFGHHQQSTFGIGDDRSAAQWRTLYRQLIAKGYLSVDVAGHGSVCLTEISRPVLRGEVTLMLRKLSVSASSKSSVRRSRARAIAPEDKKLWERLRSLRKTLSEGKPAYVVFSDSTLAEMVEQKPVSNEQMAAVSGVGQHKLEKYGEAFIDAIRDYEMYGDLPSDAAVD